MLAVFVLHFIPARSVSRRPSAGSFIFTFHVNQKPEPEVIITAVNIIVNII